MDLELTQEEIAYLKEFYVPYPLSGGYGAKQTGSSKGKT